MFKLLQHKTFYSLRLLFTITFFILLQKNLLATGAASIPHNFQATPGFQILPATTAFFATSTPLDEWDTLVSPPGFNFNFSGNTYSKIVVSSNGWVALCPPATATLPPVFTGNAFPNNELANNTTGYPILAPLWDDLSAASIGWNFATPNVVWIRWVAKWQKTSAAGASGLFYIKLDGNTSIITFYYSNIAAYVPTSPSASIGISSWLAGDFYSVNSTSASTAYVDSNSENTTIGQGTGNTIRPYNCTYVFTPRLATGISSIEMLKPQVFPVPAREEITVKYNLKTTTGIRIQIVDQQGKVVYTESVDGVGGFNVFHKNLDDIAPGNYYISILATKPENRFEIASFIKY